MIPQPAYSSVILIGYSGHAYVVADAIYSNAGTIKGYCDAQLKTENPFDLDYLGQESAEFLEGQEWIVAIGDIAIRRSIFEMYRTIGNPMVVSHATAVIGAKCEVGSGTFLAANAILNPLSKVGNGCIINTGAIIEHECEVGDFSHIAPGAVLAGNVSIGESSFVGANSVIKQGVSIGNNVIIGAGSVVLKDVPDQTTVVGNPAKKIK